MSKAEFWCEMARDMHQGLPAADDEGLDNTHTWGRTYWGGALFCLLADIEIRKRTGNRRSLEDALRGIVAAGGTIAAEWNFERALNAGDRAVGVPVLRELYGRMGNYAVAVDLEKLWRELGVEVRGDEVLFDDRAPLAHV